MNVGQVVANWMAEEEAVCARLSAPGITTQEQLAGLSGMEFFEGILAGKTPPAPIGDTLDFVAIRVNPGSVVFQGRPHRRHYNPLGQCIRPFRREKGFNTLELKINMVRALTDQVPLIRAEGRVIHAGRQVQRQLPL